MGKKAIYGCCDDGLKGHKYISSMAKILGLKPGENPVVNYIAGGIYDYVNGNPIVIKHNQEIARAVLESKKVTKVCPWNHERCFIYDLFCANFTPDEKRTKQINDLLKIVKIFEQNDPGIEVIPAYADLIDPENKIFEFRLISDLL